jgi:D-sedoheptulose 7-phosphate isomerase
MGVEMSNELIEAYFEDLKKSLSKIDLVDATLSVKHVIEQITQKKRIFIAGNGGSSSIASHMANDFTKGLHAIGARTTLVFCLNDNYPTISAIANDINFESIFRLQLEMFAEPGDSVILISGSGNSKNVLEAADYAIANQISVIGITGYDGGTLHEIANYRFNIPVNDMQVAEDLMSTFGHLVYKGFVEKMNE